MNQYELFEAIGYISDTKINQAENYCRKKRDTKPTVKRANIVLSSAALVIGCIFLVERWDTYKKLSELSSGNTNTEDANAILPEQYRLITFHNSSYYFTNQILEADDVESKIGSGTAVYYSNSQQQLSVDCDVYSIKDKSTEAMIAVKLGEEYYIYSIQD